MCRHNSGNDSAIQYKEGSMNCENCYHWEYNSKQTAFGHCGLYSSACATAIFNKGEPTRFLPMSEVPGWQRDVEQISIGSSEEKS